MGKVIRMDYICDRCGKVIEGENAPWSIGRFRFMHVFKWWIPEPVRGYKLHYVCHECFRSFKKWYEEITH